MPRGSRVVPENGIFHVTLRGNNRKRIFYRDCEFRRFRSTLERYIEKYNISLYHYCLMVNHVHLSLGITDPANLPKFMQGLELSYCHYQRRVRKFAGHLWQGRYISKVIDTDTYLLSSSLYIERNPVDSGTVKDPQSYPWSSYRHYAFGEPDVLIKENPLYLGLGENLSERQREYRKLMKKSLGLYPDNEKR